MEDLKIGENHMGDVLWYHPVLGNIRDYRSRDVLRTIARVQKYSIDPKSWYLPQTTTHERYCR